MDKANEEQRQKVSEEAKNLMVSVERQTEKIHDIT